MLGLHCYVWASCSGSEWRLTFVAAHGHLRVATSLVAEHRLCARASAVGHAGSVAVVHSIWSTDSVAVVHRLSCSLACTVFLDQGSNLCPLHWQVDFYPLYQQGGPVLFIFEIISY